MARIFIAGLVSLALLGFCAWATVTEYVIRPNAPFDGGCALWLDHPEARWVLLTGCVLDTERIVVESEQGDFELLANRKKGLSSKLYETTPTWTTAWVPVRSPGGANVIRAAFRIDSKDLMSWVNALERADEAGKERLWEDPVVLRRIVRPGVLSGHAEKPANEGLQKAYGALASSAMLTILPGKPPPPKVPEQAIFAGVFGLLLAAWVARMATRSPRLDDATPEQLAGTTNTRDVKLEIGELEEIRREERRRKG